MVGDLEGLRLEPMARLLPQEHPLATQQTVPMAALRGTQVDASVGNDHAPEWVDLGVRLLTTFGAEPSPPHQHADGVDETVQHPRSHGRPILTLLERPLVADVVVRPLTDPVPLYPWTMVFRRDLRHPGLDALQASIDELASKNTGTDSPSMHGSAKPTRPPSGSAPTPSARPTRQCTKEPRE